MKKSVDMIRLLRASLSESGEMVKHCIAQVQGLLGGVEMPKEERTLLLGKDSAVAALTRLLSLQKQVIELLMQVDELEQVEKKKSVGMDVVKPLTNADWEVLEASVRRWREGQKD
jgi:hypothetical protein